MPRSKCFNLRIAISNLGSKTIKLGSMLGSKLIVQRMRNFNGSLKSFPRLMIGMSLFLKLVRQRGRFLDQVSPKVEYRVLEL